VFIIDASNRKRFPEAKTELKALLDDEQIESVPFVILGNKIDRPNSAGEQEIRNYFNLNGKTTGKVIQ
jgi:GTP-binding protein SAR1